MKKKDMKQKEKAEDILNAHRNKSGNFKKGGTVQRKF